MWEKKKSDNRKKKKPAAQCRALTCSLQIVRDIGQSRVSGVGLRVRVRIVRSDIVRERHVHGVECRGQNLAVEFCAEVELVGYLASNQLHLSNLRDKVEEQWHKLGHLVLRERVELGGVDGELAGRMKLPRKLLEEAAHGLGHQLLVQAHEIGQLRHDHEAHQLIHTSQSEDANTYTQPHTAAEQGIPRSSTGTRGKKQVSAPRLRKEEESGRRGEGERKIYREEV